MVKVSNRVFIIVLFLLQTIDVAGATSLRIADTDTLSAPLVDAQKKLPGEFATEIGNEMVSGETVGQDASKEMGSQIAETYQRALERLLIDLRRVREAFEQAATHEEMEQAQTKAQFFIDALEASYRRMPGEYGKQGLVRQELHDARSRHRELYRAISAAQRNSDAAALVQLNNEALGLNFMIMKLRLMRAHELLVLRKNWMAALYLLDGAVHSAGYLKREIFFRDFRLKRKPPDYPDEAALDAFLRRIDFSGLATRSAAGERKDQIAGRVHWVKVGDRLREVKRMLKAGVIPDVLLKERLLTVLEQFAQYYRNPGAPAGYETIAQALTKLSGFLEQVPTGNAEARILPSGTQEMINQLIEQISGIIGDDKVKVRIPIKFDDSAAEMRSEIDTIASAEQEIDALTVRIAILEYMIVRLKEKSPLFDEEQAFFREELKAMAEWIDGVIVPDKERAKEKIRYARALVERHPMNSDVMERVRGYLEGTKQDRGVVKLLEDRRAYCRTRTIRNAKERLYRTYRTWADEELFMLLDAFARACERGIVVQMMRSFNEIEEYLADDQSAFYRSVQPEIAILRDIAGQGNWRAHREVRRLIEQIQTKLKQVKFLPAVVQGETQAILEAA